MDIETSTKAEEGKQIQLLRVIFHKAFEDSVEGVTVEQFKNIFHDIPKLKRKLPGIYAVFKQRLLQGLKSQFETLFEEEEFDLKFKQREELLEEQKQYEGTIAWRPSGSVEDNVRGHDLAVLETRRDQLSDCLDAEERSVAELMEEVCAARARAACTQEKLRHLFSDVQEKIVLLEDITEMQTRSSVSLEIPVTEDPLTELPPVL